MFEASGHLRDEFAQLEAELASQDLHANAGRSRKVGRRYNQLAPIIAGLDEWERLIADLSAAEELAQEDSDFAQEAADIRLRLGVIEERLTSLLAPRDPNDDCDVIMEIKAGAGGEESALFADDLLQMYTAYSLARGWKLETLDIDRTDLNGIKSATLAIRGKADDSPYGTLKFEGGVHRVQRVPVTESQGRIHTSAAGVLVMPDVEAEDVEIADEDLRIDVYRSSSKGGQGVNTTDSAIRITHLPSGIVVTCQDQRSQLQNKEQGMRILRARLTALAEEQAASQASAARKSQVRTVDRSERIRTYNFPENRLADHRIGYKAHNLDAVLGGDMTALIEALQAADLAERLSAPQP